jgi:peptidyl-tRNA hydrolase
LSHRSSPLRRPSHFQSPAELAAESARAAVALFKKAYLQRGISPEVLRAWQEGGSTVEVLLADGQAALRAAQAAARAAGLKTHTITEAGARGGGASSEGGRPERFRLLMGVGPGPDADIDAAVAPRARAMDLC